MNERPAPADDDARRWASATLGVAEDAPVDVIRAAFLKQIGEADFYPSQESVVAWQSLSGGLAGNPRARRILSQQVIHELRKQVEHFAEAFFSINVAERVRKWFDLNTRCQSSAALSARLDGLSVGLHVDRDAALASLPTAEDAADDAAASERQVATRIFELFVLRPVDRAERQQELLEAWQADLKSWQTPARKLRKQFPKIAELDPEFVDAILDTPWPARRAATTTTYPVASPTPATTTSGRSWPLSIAIFLGLMCVSAISRCSQENNRPRSRFPPPTTRHNVDIIQRMVENQNRPQPPKQTAESANDEPSSDSEARPLPSEPAAENSQLERDEANDEAPTREP